MNNTYTPIKIFTLSRTQWISNILQKILETNGIASIVTTNIDCISEDLYIILCHHQIDIFPQYYIIYQLEQINKSTYFTDKYMYAIDQSIFTFDYSELNIKNISKPFLYFPVPVKNTVKKINKYCYDIVFYGTLNERRTIILNKLQSYGKYNIHIITDKFGEDLLNEISKGKIILNLHYYKTAVLETARLNESLQFENIIISEVPDIDDPNYMVYKHGVHFINEINDDLSNFSQLIDTIDECLNLDTDINYNKRIEFINLLKIQHDVYAKKLCDKIKTTQFLHKLNIPIHQHNNFNNLEEFMQRYYGNEWNYTKIMKKIIEQPIEMFKYFCCNELEEIRLTNLKEIKNKNKFEAVLIESSDYPHVEFILRNTIDKLSSNWSHTVVCSNYNYNYIKQICAKISDQIRILQINSTNLLTDITFWEKINGENILIYNSSCCLNFDMNECNINEYDLIGANIFSLRKKSAMIKVLQNYNFSDYEKKIINSTNKLNHNIYYGNSQRRKALMINLQIEKKKLNEFSFFTQYLNCAPVEISKNFLELVNFKTNEKFIKVCTINWDNDKKFIRGSCNNDIIDLNKINTTHFGFIILRHINSETSQKYWLHCYDCIRKFYTDPIVIIDDNSNPDLINNLQIHSLVNTIIINSEFGYTHGEILPYYYLYKLHLFDKAVILHDSMFIKKEINFKDMDENFLWSFDGLYENYNYELFLLNKLNYSTELIKLHSNPSRWKGCFGCTGIVKYLTIKYFNEKYNIFNILKYINTRSHRSCFERIIALLYLNEGLLKPALNGSIWNHYKCFQFTYEEYITHNIDTNIIKVWSGR